MRHVDSQQKLAAKNNWQGCSSQPKGFLEEFVVSDSINKHQHQLDTNRFYQHWFSSFSATKLIRRRRPGNGVNMPWICGREIERWLCLKTEPPDLPCFFSVICSFPTLKITIVIWKNMMLPTFPNWTSILMGFILQFHRSFQQHKPTFIFRMKFPGNCSNWWGVVTMAIFGLVRFNTKITNSPILKSWRREILMFLLMDMVPVVPHKAVAKVSKIGNL